MRKLENHENLQKSVKHGNRINQFLNNNCINKLIKQNVDPNKDLQGNLKRLIFL